MELDHVGLMLEYFLEFIVEIVSIIFHFNWSGERHESAHVIFQRIRDDLRGFVSIIVVVYLHVRVDFTILIIRIVV